MKETIETEIVKVKVFIADDGRKFKNKDECLSYEYYCKRKIKLDNRDLIILYMLIIPCIFYYIIFGKFNFHGYHIIFPISSLISILSLILFILRKANKTKL